MLTDLKIKITRSKRRSLVLTVTADATIVVKAPRLTPMFFINSFIKQHEEWIHDKLAKIKVQAANAKQYKTGEKFLFLGMELQFQVGNYTEISVQKNKLLFPEFMLFRAKKQLTSWYKKQAKELIAKQTDYWAEKMNTSYGSLTFSDTRSQWGSCSAENNLQFSWRLVMAPYLTLNYVIIHELAHTKEKNHSRTFWGIVEKYNPSYRIQRKWLKKYGHTLIV